MNALYSQPFVAAVNHLLTQEEWARARLQPFADKRVHIRIAPLPTLRLLIGPGGLLEASGEDEADLTLSIRPGSLPGVLRQDEAALREIDVVGDTELAAVIRTLFRELRWDVEEDLSRVVGDIAAHRLVSSGRAVWAWQHEAAQRLGENLSEYLREEAPLLARREAVDAYNRNVATLRDDVARLEKRIRLQEERRAGTGADSPTD